MEEVYTQTKIKRAIYRLTEDVEKVAHKPLHIHVVMDGGFMFAADFVRAYIGRIAKINFIRVSRGYSTGKVHPPHFQEKAPAYLRNLSTRHTHLILDVCTETGVTLAFMKGAVSINNPNVKILTCVLVGIRRMPLEADLVGLLCTQNLFLTGYGMGPRRDTAAIYGVPK